MKIQDIVVGQFIIATHVLGSDNYLDALFMESAPLEIGTAYKVLQVDAVSEDDTQPICIELPSGVLSADTERWWCHPKYFTAQESK